MKKSFLLLLTAGFLFASCKSNLEPEKASSGQADFSKYVAIGNSLTAGYSDNSLYKSGQMNSYPALLAAQFKYAGGGDFKQPLLPGNAGWPSRKLVLGYVTDCLGNVSLGPLPYSGPSDVEGSDLSISSEGPFNNFGIPGIRCVDVGFPGYPFLNPYAKRFISNPSTTTVMAAALETKPTFFSLWLGNNDILGYATNGGEGIVGGLGLSDISPFPVFKQTYELFVQKLVEGNAKGILINIPDITSIPFFTTIDPKGLELSSTQASQLTAAYAPLGIHFSEGANYFMIQDLDAPGGMRQIKDGEFILITTPGDSLKCAGWGSLRPIPKQYVLSEDEVANVKTATQQFNEVIVAQAEKYNLAMMDANAYIKTLKSGITWDGTSYSTAFVTGGAFSLDGVHLTPRGYALVANQIIRTINAHYHSTVPFVEVNQKNGILFP